MNSARVRTAGAHPAGPGVEAPRDQMADRRVRAHPAGPGLEAPRARITDARVRARISLDAA
ncbi:hypothetical protein [Dactylosporangium sp. CS-033363]|uniref:hypothetical protein n=1 Tax=Dactylosporangium sp. CS-033363 TaxID=3239935 RepID=UPI003D8E4AE4